MPALWCASANVYYTVTDQASFALGCRRFLAAVAGSMLAWGSLPTIHCPLCGADRQPGSLIFTMTAAAAHEASQQAALVPLPQLVGIEKYNPNSLLHTFKPKAELERRWAMCWLPPPHRPAAFSSAPPWLPSTARPLPSL